MAASSSSSGSTSNEIDGYSFDPSILSDFFEPLFFEPIVSWEHEMIEVLWDEGNCEELEWFACLLSASHIQ